jgi:bacteriorhodopsin
MVADAALKGFLDPNDPVAISFWIISIAMVAATVFFLMEATIVGNHWKTSMHSGALVTLVAAVHYFYMREFWVQIGTSPIVYRYIDWSITVPLLMIEFYLILAAVQPDIGQGVFWRLLIGTIAMLAAGYLGEAQIINAWAGFIFGMAGWGVILFEIFMGEAGKCAESGDMVGVHVKSAFTVMRFIVIVGWSIYPLGYFFGYLLGGVDDAALNLAYNLADVVNKIAFCLAIWSSAKTDTAERMLLDAESNKQAEAEFWARHTGKK